MLISSQVSLGITHPSLANTGPKKQGRHTHSACESRTYKNKYLVSKQPDHDHANKPSTSLLAAAEQEELQLCMLDKEEKANWKALWHLAALCVFLFWTPVTFPTLAHS